MLIYDGDCDFCSLWIHRWQRAGGEHLDFLPVQHASVAARFPEVPLERFAAAVQLIDSDGRVYGGAEAVFRALARAPRRAWLLRQYQRSPAFARASDWAYRFVAMHRSFCLTLTRLIICPCRPTQALTKPPRRASCAQPGSDLCPGDRPELCRCNTKTTMRP